MVPFWVPDIHHKATVYQQTKKPGFAMTVFTSVEKLACDFPYWPTFTVKNKGTHCMPWAPAMGAEIAKQRASVSHLMIEIVAQDALCLCGLYRLPYITGTYNSACKQSSEPGDLVHWSLLHYTRWYRGRETLTNISYFNRCTFALAFARRNRISKGHVLLCSYFTLNQLSFSHTLKFGKWGDLKKDKY